MQIILDPQMSEWVPMIVKMELPKPEPQSSNAHVFDKWMIQWKTN